MVSRLIRALVCVGVLLVLVLTGSISTVFYPAIGSGSHVARAASDNVSLLPVYFTSYTGAGSQSVIDSLGQVKETFQAFSLDRRLTIYVPAGTFAKDGKGGPLSVLKMGPADSPPPAPPKGASMVGLTYLLEPNGSTFRPSAKLTWFYLPSDLPKGATEEELFLAFWDGQRGWVLLEGATIDTENDTISVPVSHFSTLALFVRQPAAFTFQSLVVTPAEVNAGASVGVSVSVTNTGGVSGSYEVALKINSGVVEKKVVTLERGATQRVTFNLADNQMGSYSVEIEGLRGKFEVKPPKTPASFTVGALTVSPAEVTAGERVTITVPVTNQGDLQGVYRVTLLIEGQEAESREVTVGGHQTRTATFSVTKSTAGTYSVKVEDRVAAFQVRAKPPTPAATPAPAPPEAVRNTWLLGLSIVGFVTGSLILFLAVRRKGQASKGQGMDGGGSPPAGP